MQQVFTGELNLTKRRAVDLCRVATCLCRMSWPGRPHPSTIWSRSRLADP